jgi:gliding motility-associated-like protein
MKRIRYLVPVFLFLGWHCLEAKDPSSYSLVSRTDTPLNITGTTLQDTCTLGLGSIDITVTGGTPPYTFAWSNGASTEDVTGLVGGNTYSVTVTDASSATQEMSFSIVNYAINWYPGFSDYYTWIWSNNTSCTGQSNAFVEFTPLTNLPFMWLWVEDSVTTASRYDIPVGFYHIEITLGTCWRIMTFDFTNQPDPPVLTAGLIDPTCSQPNGSIDLTVTNSEPPYTYAWSNGATTEDVFGLTSGTYTVIVTGANACADTASYTLGGVPLFSLSGTASPASSCLYANGSIDLTLTPVGSYGFVWSNGAATEDIFNLAAGGYSVTVTGSNGCTNTASFVVEDTAQPPALSAALTAATCGLSNGAVNLTASGGSAPYTFSWSNGATTEDLADVPAGSYTVTVTGEYGCTATAPATVQGDTTGADTTAISGTTCDSNGVGTFTEILTNQNGCDSVVITTVSLLPSDTTQLTGTTCDSNGVGTFTEILTNQNGCDSVVITTVSLLSSDTTLLSSTTCDSNEAGTFTETLINQNGCDSVVITTVSLLPSDTTQLTGTTCDANEAGTFTEILTNQNGCDSVVITTVSLLPSDTTQLSGTTCDANEAGTFTETLTNQNGCDSVVITTVSLLPSDTTQLTGTTCDANEAGTFTETLANQNGCDSVVITTVSLLPGDTTQLSGTTCDATGAGTFTETLTNQNGCDSVVITTVSLLPGDTTLLFETSCDTGNTGVFTQNLTNQFGCDSMVVTTVTFSEADTTLLSSQTCDAASAGVFTSTFVNSEGCDSVVIETISLLPSDTTYLSDTSCDPNNSGTFTQILTNVWGCDSLVVTTVSFSEADTTLLSSQTCDVASAGVFTNTFVNSEGCDSVVIETVGLLPSDTTYLSDTSCDPNDTGTSSQTLTNFSGCDSLVVTTVTFSEADTTLLNGTTCNPAAAGVFTNTFVNSEGCDSMVIETVSLLPTDTTYLSDTSCDPNNAGTFVQTLINVWGCDSTVITTVTFAKSDTTLLTSSTCDAQAAGVFAQTLTSTDGCDSVVIETVDLLLSDTILLSSQTCDPFSTGIFINTFTNQSGCDSTVIETVSLLPSDTIFLSSQTCDPNAAGVFTQNLTNQSGCDSTVIATISLLPSDTILLSSQTCDPSEAGVFTSVFTNQNGCDSTVTLTVALLASDTTFLFFESCEPADTGTVVSTFTNQAGCDSAVVAMTGLLLSPSLKLTASDFSGFSVSCSGAADGSILAEATGTGPFSFAWSTGSSGNPVTGLAAGSYAVTVTSANGCTAGSSVSLSEPDSLQIAFAVNQPGCFDENAGAIFVETSGGVPPWRFSIDGVNFQPSNAFTSLSAGAYHLSVLDANDCEKEEIILINVPLPVSVDLGEDRSIDFGDGLVLEAVVNMPFDSLASVVWTALDSAECPACLTQPIAPLITTSYSVSVVAYNGCKDDDQLTVFVDRRKHVYVPNAFSPNGDGVNDVFRIFAKPGTVKKVKSFHIFSRWGETVYQYFNFQPNDPAYGWDGTHRGEALEPAVFAWFAEIEFLDGKTEVFEGDVTLVR